MPAGSGRQDSPPREHPAQLGRVEVTSRVAPAFDRATTADLITIAEGARLAGVHRNTVRSWCASGRLSSVRINRRGDRRIHRAEIQGLVARRTARPAEPARPAELAELTSASRPLAPDDAPAQPSEASDPRRREDAIRKIAAEVSRRTDLDTILADVIGASVGLFSADRAALWLFEPDLPKPFQLAAHDNLSPALREATTRISSADDEAIVRCVLDLRVEVLTDPAGQAHAPALRAAYERDGIATACFVPIVFGESALGVLSILHQAKQAWPATEIELAQAFADQVASAIANARLRAETHDLAARLRAIQALSGRLNGLNDVGAIGEAIVAEARDLIDFDNIRVYRVDHEHGMCEPIAFQGTFMGIPNVRADAPLPARRGPDRLGGGQ